MNERNDSAASAGRDELLVHAPRQGKENDATFNTELVSVTRESM